MDLDVARVSPSNLDRSIGTSNPTDGLSALCWRSPFRLVPPLEWPPSTYPSLSASFSSDDVDIDFQFALDEMAISVRIMNGLAIISCRTARPARLFNISA